MKKGFDDSEGMMQERQQQSNSLDDVVFVPRGGWKSAQILTISMKRDEFSSLKTTILTL